MGIFSKFKQFGERMEAASQQMVNTQLTVTVDNQQVKIGEELSGTITITSKMPLIIKGFSVNLLRETSALGAASPVGKNQWVFNKETILTPFQLQPGETKTVTFKFLVKDGLEYQPLSNGVFDKTSIIATGLNPAVLPDSKYGPYDHKLNVTAQIESAPIGPIGGTNINFVYPDLSVSLS